MAAKAVGLMMLMAVLWSARVFSGLTSKSLLVIWSHTRIPRNAIPIYISKSTLNNFVIKFNNVTCEKRNV